MNLTIASVKAFYAAGAHLVLMAAVLAGREHAEKVREHVDSYTEPLFATFSFTDTYTGEPVTRSKDLFMSDDDEGCEAFYAACDKAHKAHGFELEPGYCPALMAENAVIDAERALLEAAAVHYGIDFDNIYNLELRAKALDLFLNPPMAKKSA